MEIKIHIKTVSGNQMAAMITGTFEIEGHSFKFRAIAFGRIGGHNISAKISKTTQKQLVNLGHNIDDILNELQQRLVRGDIALPEGLTRESFADG
jgi:hypothetical protein